MRLKVHELIKMKQNEEKMDKKETSAFPEVINQLRNTLKDTELTIIQQKLDEGLEYTLWNGFTNEFGLYGPKKNTHKSRSASIAQSRGRVFNVDYGQHSIGREQAFLRPSVIIADYSDISIVIPATSETETKFDNLAPDIQKAVIKVDSSIYTAFSVDSYLLLHQMRAVSKNRLRKNCGSIAKTELMKTIEEKLYKFHSPYIKKTESEKIKILEQNLELQTKQLEELERIISQQGLTHLLPEAAVASDKV